METIQRHRDIKKGKERQHKDINKGRLTKHKDINRGKPKTKRKKTNHII